MPKQRWRHGVREDLRGVREALDGLRDEMHDELGGMREELGGMREELGGMREEIRGMRGDLRREFQQNRDVLRHLKASIDQSTEMTHQCVETLAVMRAESHASRVALEDLTDDIRAQRDGLLLVLDELRRRR
jgi:methyl-accepting chemotaxis protein